MTPEAHADDASDPHTPATLLLAAVLFSAAVSERFACPRARAARLVVAGIGLAGGVLVILSRPVTTG